MSTPTLTPSILPQSIFATPIASVDLGDKGTYPAYMRSQVWQRILQSFALVGQIPALLTGSHELRLSANAAGYASGSLFYESDRKLYYISSGKSWLYFNGIYAVEQTGIPTGLSVSDAGMLVEVTDYAHLLMWDGAQFTWGDSDPINDYYIQFVSGPNPATGWHQCDGSTILKLNPDGTLSLVTIPNSAGFWYRQ
jgi:hypothetical protein